MSDIGSIADRASDCQPCPARLPLGLLTRGTSPSLRSNRTVPAKRNHPCGSFITALYPKELTTLTQRPYVFTPKTSPLYSKDLTFLNKTAPLPRYYGLGPTPRFAFASTRSPKLLSELSTRVPPMPRRVSSAQVSSAESCWLHDVRTLATRDFVTRLHERGSLALSLIRLSGETPAHRSRTRLRALRVAFGEVPSESLSPFCGASLHGLPS